MVDFESTFKKQIPTKHSLKAWLFANVLEIISLVKNIFLINLRL